MARLGINPSAFIGRSPHNVDGAGWDLASWDLSI